MPFIDITGNTYNQLTVLKEVLPRCTPTKWLCSCACGNTKEVVGARLKNGSTKSCGCLHIQVNKDMFTKHGAYLDKLYQVHRSIIQRCFNSKHRSYKDYGGRGISLFTPWKEYKVFQAWAISTGYKRGLTIERIDVNQGYTPNNCTWASREQQSRNRRARHDCTSKYIGVHWDKSRNKWFTCVGVSNKTIALGRYASEIEAAQVRDAYIKQNNLEHFVLNFP